MILVIEDATKQKLMVAVQQSEDCMRWLYTLSDADCGQMYQNIVVDIWRQLYIHVFARKGLDFTTLDVFAHERRVKIEIGKLKSMNWCEAEAYVDTKSLYELTAEIWGQEYAYLYRRLLKANLFTFCMKFYENLSKNMIAEAGTNE